MATSSQISGRGSLAAFANRQARSSSRPFSSSHPAHRRSSSRSPPCASYRRRSSFSLRPALTAARGFLRLLRIHGLPPPGPFSGAASASVPLGCGCSDLRPSGSRTSQTRRPDALPCLLQRLCCEGPRAAASISPHRRLTTQDEGDDGHDILATYNDLSRNVAPAAPTH